MCYFVTHCLSWLAAGNMQLMAVVQSVRVWDQKFVNVGVSCGRENTQVVVEVPPDPLFNSRKLLFVY
jgi:hypothetical protein